MKVKTEHLKKALESVSPGLSSKNVIEQADCFVFYKGWIFTFNDEISCCVPLPTGLKIEGAVKAAPLMRTLEMLNVEEIDIEIKGKKLMIKVRKKKICLKIEEKISLATSLIDHIKHDAFVWHPLQNSLSKRIMRVVPCASSDASQSIITCVHFTPKFVEANDRYQAARHTKKTGFKESVLLDATTAKHVAKFVPKNYSIRDSWIYFRNADDVFMICRMTMEEYPSLDSLMKKSGEVTTLPEGLAKVIKAAAVFSADGDDHNLVLVTLKKDKLIVKGEGAAGWYREVKKIKWRGKEISFYIAPSILASFAGWMGCEVSEKFLISRQTHFHFVTCLGSYGADDDEK